MATAPVPRGIDDVTPAWLSDALRDAGLDVRVASMEAEDLGEGVGANGLTCRLRLTYAAGGGDGPASLVLKLPPTIPASKDIGVRLRFYANEVNFYTQVAGSVAMRVPRCYYAGMDEERHDYALLLEDMTPAQPGDDLAGCSLAEAEAIVDQLPRLHAPWWKSPRLAALDWLPMGEPNVAAANQRFQETLFPAVIRNFGATLSPDAYRVAERYSRSLEHVVRQMTAAPYTLTHSDYRLVNLLLDGPPQQRAVTVLDWQRVAVGKGPIDLAFFTVLSLPTADRLAWQWDLVERYHAGLQTAGVERYSLEACRRDYRLCAFAPSRIALAHASRDRADLGGPTGVALQAALIQRAAAALVDLQMEEFL